jgi:hypothetical protein
VFNVTSTERTVGFSSWTRLTGFSEQVLGWVQTQEIGNT